MPQLFDRPRNRLDKKRADGTKAAFRKAARSEQALFGDDTHESLLTNQEKHLLKQFRDGTLLTEKNSAVRAHGHGTYTDEESRQIQLGGSTGGLMRQLLDYWRSPEPSRSVTSV